jgi:hypothetical protein
MDTKLRAMNREYNIAAQQAQVHGEVMFFKQNGS